MLPPGVPLSLAAGSGCWVPAQSLLRHEVGTLGWKQPGGAVRNAGISSSPSARGVWAPGTSSGRWAPGWGLLWVPAAAPSRLGSSALSVVGSQGGLGPASASTAAGRTPSVCPCALRLAASWMLMGRLSLSGRGERCGGVPGVCWAAGAGAKCLVMGSPDLGTCPCVPGTLEPRPRLRHARDTGTRPRPRPRGSVPPLVSAPLLPSRRLVGAG